MTGHSTRCRFQDFLAAAFTVKTDSEHLVLKTKSVLCYPFYKLEDPSSAWLNWGKISGKYSLWRRQVVLFRDTDIQAGIYPQSLRIPTVPYWPELTSGALADASLSPRDRFEQVSNSKHFPPKFRKMQNSFLKGSWFKKTFYAFHFRFVILFSLSLFIYIPTPNLQMNQIRHLMEHTCTFFKNQVFVSNAHSGLTNF